MLQQLELLIHGLAPGDLTSSSRSLIRQVGPLSGTGGNRGQGLSTKGIFKGPEGTEMENKIYT